MPTADRDSANVDISLHNLQLTYHQGQARQNQMSHSGSDPRQTMQSLLPPDKLPISDSGTTFAVERGAVLGEIDVCLQKLIDLKTHLNSFTHINRLPNEILAEILVVYARDCYLLTARGSTSTSTGPLWLRLAHVCRHWREVAFDTPRFWSYVHVKQPKTFVALLPLSKISPLCIGLAMDELTRARNGAWESATDLIGQQSHRLQELCYVSTSKFLWRLAEKFNPPLPLLERLVLERWGSPFSFMSQPLPLLSIAGHTPRLRHLELRHVPVAWTDPTFYSGLTTLVIITKVCRHDGPSIGTFEQFLDALQAMAPSLVHLILEDSVPRLQSYLTEPPLSDRTIILASLRTLSVICNTNDCVHLLDNLSVNSAATMRFTGHGTTGIRRLVEHLSDHFSRSAPLRRLNISFARSTGEIFIAGYKNPERDVLQDNNDPAMRLVLDILPGGALSLLLTATLEGANTLFSRVKTLSLCLSENIDWSRLFARTPCVTTLIVRSLPGQGFFTALSDVSASVPLCQLQKLTLKLADARCEPLRGCKRSKGTFFDQLLDWVILRCNYGVPLEMLKIWSSKYARNEDLSRLRQVVGQVEWGASE